MRSCGSESVRFQPGQLVFSPGGDGPASAAWRSVCGNHCFHPAGFLEDVVLYFGIRQFYAEKGVVLLAAFDPPGAFCNDDGPAMETLQGSADRRLVWMYNLPAAGLQQSTGLGCVRIPIILCSMDKQLPNQV